MRRPGYREAVDWLVRNDDTEWATYDAGGQDDGMATLSVTGALVCDLFDVGTERLRGDIRRGLTKLGRPSKAK